MKRIVIAMQNALVGEAVSGSLKRRGFFVEKSLSWQPERIAALCGDYFADLCLMDVGRSAESSFEVRVDTVQRIRKKTPTVKTGLFCDNLSDPEIAFRVKQAKEEGIIDVFFYESVRTDYMADVVDSL